MAGLLDYTPRRSVMSPDYVDDTDPSQKWRGLLRSLMSATTDVPATIANSTALGRMAQGLLGMKVQAPGDLAPAAQGHGTGYEGGKLMGDALLSSIPMMRGGSRGALSAKNQQGAVMPAKTQFELAHEQAQRNAALPVSQGGLGLRADNTAMERAAAMGFLDDAWHGTNRDVLPGFDMSMLGENTGAASAKRAVFAAGDKATPQSYVFGEPRLAIDSALARQRAGESPEKWMESLRKAESQVNALLRKERGGLLTKGSPLTKLESAELSRLRDFITGEYQMAQIADRSATRLNPATATDAVEGGARGWVPISQVENPSPNIMPLKLNTKGFATKDYGGSGFRDESYASLLDANKDAPGVVFQHTTDGGPVTSIYAVTDPRRIRSRFAAFDPMKRDSADLLAGIAGMGLLSPMLYDELRR